MSTVGNIVIDDPSRVPRLGAFLIIGAQRSGTSLLTRILNRHPMLAVPPESFFFNTFAPLRRYYGDLRERRRMRRFIADVLSTPKIREWSPIPSMETVLTRVRGPTMGDVFVALMESWAASQNKTVWGEKTPHHVFHWAELATAVPNAPVINIVRDGRDVALGLIKARFGPKTIYSAAQRWQRWLTAIEEIRAKVPVDRFQQLRYEDLLLRPVETLTELCSFLGYEYAPQMLDFHADKSLYSTYADEHANLQKPLLVEKVEGWRRCMKSDDVALFEAINADWLRRYGYAVEHAPRTLSRWEHVFFRNIHHPPRKAIALLRNEPGRREEAQLLMMRVRVVASALLQHLVR
jgi:hypothetical protein